MLPVPFNKPHLTGNETTYVEQAVMSGKISGDGMFTRKCHDFFEKRYGFQKCLLTHSCTAALEMAAILLDIRPGDEVIMPAYTFVSTANAFVLRGAKIVFADSSRENPNMDADSMETLITARTKAIVVVHYGGIAVDMDRVMRLASQHGLYVIEDAAQAIESFYKGSPLGSIGHFAAFSFHETKNIMCGEGGMLVIRDAQFNERAEIIREKGTNRSAFFRGEVDKYTWVDIGSSYLPSDINAAFLFGQLEHLEAIQQGRKTAWQRYYDALQVLAPRVSLPHIPGYATNNAHLFYFVTQSPAERDGLLSHLRKHDIWAIFHYTPLHLSPYFKEKHDGRALPMAEHYAGCLVRLPLFFTITVEQQQYVIDKILEYYAA